MRTHSQPAFPASARSAASCALPAARPASSTFATYHLLVREVAALAQRLGEQVVVVATERPHRRAALDVRLERLQDFQLGADLGIDLGELADAGDARLEHLEVGEQQLVLDDRDVARGVDRPLHVDDVAVLEAADDLEDRVRVADVREELVAEPLALARALHEPRDVDELDRRVDDVLRVDHVREDREARVGDGHDRRVRLDRAEGEVLRLRVLRAGEGVEEGGLADVGQADDADVECHVSDFLACAG